MVLVAIAMATVIQAVGWAQTSNYALVRALADGTAIIDDYAWESRDTSYTDGHFYSVKAPGMGFVALPVHLALTRAGAQDAASEIAWSAREAGALRWYRAGVSSDQYANNLKLARATRSRIELYTPYVWMLNIFVCVLPALAMMLIVRSIGDSLAPGFGALAAVAAGAGTMVLPFSTLFFSHVLSAALAIGAFALLWRERAGPPRLLPLAAAGLLAGFAITTEYPLGLAAAVLGIYAVARDGLRNRTAALRRGAVYGGAAVLGVLPLLLYNLLAFGSIAHFSYENAVAVQGATGHDVLGLNDDGFFGITTPTLGNAYELLFSIKGLFVISPVLLLAAYGLVLMWRGGRRPEVAVIVAIFMLYLIYNSGYWLPFGGGTPGPRFLIPAVPFLALALAPAFKRLPATALALTVPSVVVMAAATATLPMIGNGDVGIWTDLIGKDNFEQTIASAFGSDNDWVGILPFALTLGVGVVLAVASALPLRLERDLPLAAAAIAAWAVYFAIAPHRPAAETPGSDHPVAPLIWVSVAGAVSLLVVTAVAQQVTFRRRRRLEEATATA